MTTFYKPLTVIELVTSPNGVWYFIWTCRDCGYTSDSIISYLAVVADPQRRQHTCVTEHAA